MKDDKILKSIAIEWWSYYKNTARRIYTGQVHSKYQT
jgi:hypothetical protein